MLNKQNVVFTNILGEHFFSSQNIIYKRNPETGEVEEVCKESDFDVNCLDDYWTASTLKTEWSNLHGEIGPDCYLVPIIPFCLGGEFDVKNLMKLTISEAESYYENIRISIDGLSDGSKVTINVIK